MKRSANACSGERCIPDSHDLPTNDDGNVSSETSPLAQPSERPVGVADPTGIFIDSNQVSSPLTKYQPLMSMIPIKIVVIFSTSFCLVAIETRV